jgi:hypothetical protein
MKENPTCYVVPRERFDGAISRPLIDPGKSVNPNYAFYKKQTPENPHERWIFRGLFGAGVLTAFNQKNQ